MKFMWPTWPIVGRSAASPVSTRLPPWRPASQVRPSRASLSAKKRSTLTCRTMPAGPVIGGLPEAPARSSAAPVPEHLVQRLRVSGRGERVTELFLGEHLRELREELKVLLGCLLR